LIIMRPSLARPPFALKNVMKGEVIALVFPTPTMIPGTAVNSPPYVRVAGSLRCSPRLTHFCSRGITLPENAI